LQVTEQQRSRSNENNKLTIITNEEELLKELWIQHQIEQQKQDQHDLKLFHEMRQEESDIQKAKRAYKRLVKKYVVNNSLHRHHD
jgi:hypothetical protein